jgi:hypothetical protein
MGEEDGGARELGEKDNIGLGRERREIGHFRWRKRLVFL